MESNRLGRADWLRAARKALLHGGPAAVRIEVLARKLKVTKGSFYWHFKDRRELMEALLREWEEETTLVGALLRDPDLPKALRSFFDELGKRVVSSERGESPSDAAIFAWASISPKIAKRANHEEEERIALVKRAAGNDAIGEYIYLAYLGFLLRRRRVPAAAESFARFVKVSTDLILEAQKRGRR
jgi:AcrR family transcriptional regulator